MGKENGGKVSGSMLTSTDNVDEVACRIAEMWNNYNTERRIALNTGEEARQYVFGTDIDQTSAHILPHKNRTHQPKLTQISDNLQSQYYEASLSMPMFFLFEGAKQEDRALARKIEGWVRTKLEQKKFRETVGRALLTDYVLYGNCFCDVDYTVELDDTGRAVYRGIVVRRVSPLDIVFNPRAQSFGKSPKIERKLMHISEVMDLPNTYPTSGFKTDVINKAVRMRDVTFTEDWIAVIKTRGLQMDGYGSWSAYFNQDMVEVLIYRGDVFDPITQKAQRNRIVYVIDRTFVIRNEANTAPTGFDGLHHAGWRVRSDNLWSQGPLDNLVGMQYRINHLENLKADIFDLIAHPCILIKGSETEEPANGWAPGAVYRVDPEGDVKVLNPDATALNADTQIAHYHRMMEEFAGAPPESRGIRTPGEKTAFEVSKLDANATMMFVDKARNFERMLETMLKECFELMLKYYDGGDYVEIFDDMTGEEQIRQLAKEDVNARGTFQAIGARFWTRRNRETLELNNFIIGPMKDPKIRAHLSGERLANLFADKLNFTDDKVFEPFIGTKEDVRAQAIAQSELKKFQDQGAVPTPGPGGEPSGEPGDAAGLVDSVQQGLGGPEAGGGPSQSSQ